MSWTPPACPRHCSPSTRFDHAVAWGPPDMFGLYWRCARCRARVLELGPTGVDAPAPGACLNCGLASFDGPRCRACGVADDELIARVHSACGSPPSLARVHEHAARGLFRLGFNAVDRRLQLDANDGPVLITKAKLLVDVRRPARAVVLLRRAVTLGAAPVRVAVDLGVALADSGDPAGAIVVYEALLDHELPDEQRAVALSNLGGCLSALGQAPEGEGYHRQAIGVAPQLLGPRWNLFANLVRRGQFAAALAGLDEALELESLAASERENLHAYRAELLMALGRPREALGAIDASLISEPSDLDRLSSRARILLRLGDRAGARACAATMQAVDPHNPLVRAVLDRLGLGRRRSRRR